jgi:indolepyruvate ferredoxin oxidoreductase beta subunit
MKKDIILAGVGGQGILSIANVIGQAALSRGFNIKQAEVHGMSQRGGDVQSNLRLSSRPIYSDLIALGGADVIIAMEPMEALRYQPYLSKEGWVITATAPFVNIPAYPDTERIDAALAALPHVVRIDIDTLARENKMPKAANMILLGAAGAALGMDFDTLKDAVRTVFAAKGEAIVEMNIKALEIGHANGIQ